MGYGVFPICVVFLALCTVAFTSTPATKACRWGPRKGKSHLAAVVSVYSNWKNASFGLEWGRGAAGNGWRSSRRHAHDVDCGCQEGSVLDGAFDTNRVADLDIGEGDGVAALAEDGVFVGHKGVGGVVDCALEGDFDAVHGRDLAHEPGLSVVGLHLAHLPGALGVDLQDDHRADRLGGGVDLADGGDGVAYLDVSGLERLRGIAAFTAALGRLLEDACVGAEVDGVGIARAGLDGVVAGGDFSDGSEQTPSGAHVESAAPAAALAGVCTLGTSC